ncbi:hypothetical protein FPV67DRAFT_1676203 [Lyophyllum atratum]|nr:hypothetical protein FPV67DRAFT_1676203 [Lyophyllum atratum]
MRAWPPIPSLVSSIWGPSSGAVAESDAKTKGNRDKADHGGRYGDEGKDLSEGQPIRLDGTSSTEEDQTLNHPVRSSSIEGIAKIDNRAGGALKSDSAQLREGTAGRDGRESHDSGNKDRARRSRDARDDELRLKIKTLEREKERIRGELDSERRESRALASGAYDLRRENGDLRHNLDAARRKEAEVANHCARQKQELQVVKDQLRRVDGLYELAQHQLKEQAAELHSARLFVNQADSLSGAEVIAIANALNAEILQGAALMADSLHRTHGPPPTPEAVSKARSLIGEDIVHALLSQTSEAGHDLKAEHDFEAEHDFDPTLVQFALQVCLVRCCVTIVNSWTITENDEVLRVVYTKIVGKNKQSAAGRWRSMTQCHATQSDTATHCLAWLATSIVEVLILAGYSPQDTKTTLPDSFQEGLSVVNNLVLRLRTAIGEQVTSMDIGAFAVRSGVIFNPEEMDDTYAEERRVGGKNKAGERVAGSTELGLTSRVKVGEEIQTAVMLKPKVILCSALEENS